MTPDEIELCNEIKKAREHLARLEEDLLILRSNQPQRPAISAKPKRFVNTGLEDYMPNSDFRDDCSKKYGR